MMCVLSPPPLLPLCASLSSSLCLHFFHFYLTLDLNLFCLCFWASLLSPLCVCAFVHQCASLCCFLIL